MKRSVILLATAFLGLGLAALNAQTRDYGYTFTTPGSLYMNTAAYNYTLGTTYSGTGDPGSTANTLIVRGESANSDHSIATVNGVTGYYVNTVNTQNTNFGFYLLNLNFTDISAGQNVVVNYSFKILGNDTNNSINPKSGDRNVPKTPEVIVWRSDATVFFAERVSPWG